MSDIPAGWYTDPADPATQRYWDGEGWLGAPIPADATPPEGPPPSAAAGAPAEPVPPPVGAASAGIPGGPAGSPPGQQPPTGWPAPPGAGQTPTGPESPPPWHAPPGWTPPPGWPPQGGTPPPGWMPIAYPGATRILPNGMMLADPGRRLVARLIDIIVVLVLNILVNGWFAYQWTQEMLPLIRTALQDPMNAQPQPTARSEYLILTMLALTTALWAAYEVPATGGTGQTLGKRIMRIKVVRLDNGEAPGYGRALQRWARLGVWTPLWGCWGIGFLFQVLGSASLLFDPRLRQAWHDKTAHTVVVDVPPHRHPVPAGHHQDQRAGNDPTRGVPDDDSDPTGGVR